MRNKTFLICHVFFLLVTVTLQAQSDPKNCKVLCADGWHYGVPCNTTIDPCTGGSLDPDRIKGGGFGFMKSPIKAELWGAIPGALIGSFKQDGNGKSQWGSGALVVGGFFGTLSVLTTTKNRSLGENVVLGIVAGGAAVGGASMYKNANASATAEKKPDNTLRDAAIGAVVVGGLAAALPNEGKNKGHKSSWFNRKPAFLSKISVKIYGNRIGLVMAL